MDSNSVRTRFANDHDVAALEILLMKELAQ